MKKLNFEVEKGVCALTQTNEIGLTKESMRYLWHAVGAVVLVYLCLNPATRGELSWQNLLILVLAAAVLLQAGFKNVNRQAQKCAQPKDESVVWSDGTSFWYRDAWFMTLCAGSLLYGLGVVMPGDALFFDAKKVLPKTGTLTEKLLRGAAALPTLGFVYYFIWITVRKNELIKPVRSELIWWERPLAISFSLVFIPLLLYSFYGRALVETEDGLLSTMGKLFTFRGLCAVSLFAVFYVFVWRLQGGLFASKAQYDLLKKTWGGEGNQSVE